MTTPTDRLLALPHGPLRLRAACWPDQPGGSSPAAPAALPVLLLHGISSGAASWDGVMAALPAQPLLAWDAPGYGDSAALPDRTPGGTPDNTPDNTPDTAPDADAYAAVAAQALQALGIGRVRLVGHSLGALVATALAARLGAAACADLLLLSPARGYGHDAAEATRMRQQRLQALAQRGIAGLAEALPDRLLSAQASAAQRAQVQAVAQRLTPGGYTRAVGLLCGSRLEQLAGPGAARLAGIPVRVAVGGADVVTPPEACAAAAQALGAPFLAVPGAGHALPVEQPLAVAALIAGPLPVATPAA